MKILLADDDTDLVDWLGYALHKNGFTVLKAYHGEAALRVFEKELPDAAVLDLKMPRRDGLEVLHEIRRRSDVPVIMLTGVSEEDTVIEALRAGADDYVTKPFRPRELIARIEAVMRRKGVAGGEMLFHPPLTCGAVWLDPRSRNVTVDGSNIHLTPTEFSVLEFLMLNQGAVLSVGEILERVWGPDAEQKEHAVRVIISRLRGKIEAHPDEPRYIHNVPGEGYILEDRGSQPPPQPCNNSPED